MCVVCFKQALLEISWASPKAPGATAFIHPYFQTIREPSGHSKNPPEIGEQHAEDDPSVFV